MSIVFRAGLAGWMLLATAAYAGASDVDQLILKEFVQQRARMAAVYAGAGEAQRRALWQQAMGDYLQQLNDGGLVSNYLVVALPASATTSFASSVEAHASSYSSASSFTGAGNEGVKVVIHYQEKAGAPFKTLELKP